jgi:hypothetical protein
VEWDLAKNPAQPLVKTGDFSGLFHDAVTLNGQVLNDGHAGLDERGFVISQLPLPDINDTVHAVGKELGNYSKEITNLQLLTKYYYRAYAKNGIGVGYGEQREFTTLAAPSIPVLTTKNISGITCFSASSGGDISNQGGSPVTSRGICWSTSQNPTTNDTKTVDGSGIGSFNSSLNSLTPGVTYYVRSYAINSVGVGYGNQFSFSTTIPTIPTVSTSSVTSVSTNTATVSAQITSNGTCYSSLSQKGICWSTSPNPTLSNSSVSNSATTNTYSCNLSGLLTNTTYYVRAYATNNTGTSYGNQLTFTTLNSSPPMVSTSPANSITTNSAIGNGNVTFQGTYTVTSRGICWSTSSNPTTANFTCTSGGGLGAFSCNMSGLSPNTTYYYRAFAISGAGTVYGGQSFFTTLSSTSPSVTTTSVTGVSYTSATGNGNVTSQGSSTVTSRGICWSTTPNPTTANSLCTSGSGTGTYACTMSGLSANTTYYARAFATNSAGTSYGSQVTFTTLSSSPPSVTTNSVTGITTSSATGNGNVTNQGSATVTTRGICWSTSPNPTTANSSCTSGSGTGVFSCTMSGLAVNTTYYVRAFAISSAGTSYGSQTSFTTASVPASVTTNSVSGITFSSATGNGNVTSQGTFSVTSRGICWSTSPNPTTANSTCTSGSGLGAFSCTMSGLAGSTTYYVRAFAISGAGTVYGAQTSFTTSAPTPPSITTNTVTAISSTSATGNGNITNQGSSPITQRGLCWSSINSSPTVGGTTYCTSGTGTGTFSCALTNLNPGTLYYVRAFAVNSAGTYYGSSVSFVTSSTPPAPSLVYPSNGAALTSLASQYLTFQWNSVANATNYRIDLSKSSSFAGSVITLIACPGGTGPNPSTSAYNRNTTTSTSFCINHGTSTQNGTWYWRVQAQVGGVWGSWSPTRTYTWVW